MIADDENGGKQGRNVRVLFERTALKIVGSRPLKLRFGERFPLQAFDEDGSIWHVFAVEQAR